MKYQSSPLATKEMRLKRESDIQHVIGLLINASVTLRPAMHDAQLRDMIEAAYRRASYIQGALAVERCRYND